MKNIALLFFLLLFVPMIPLQSQILTITESGREQKDTDKKNRTQIVDINGNLEVDISKTKLTDQIRIDYPQFSDRIELQSKIDALEKALINQEALLNILDQNTLQQKDRDAFYDGILSFLRAVQKNNSLREEANAILKEWRKKYGANSDNPGEVGSDYYLLTNFNKNLLTSKDELSAFKGQAFNISLVAYINTKLSDDNRVHIRNFDTYSDREFYSVPRWVTSLSDKQEAKLADLQKQADQYNTKAFSFFKDFKARLLKIFPDIECIGKLKTDIQEFLNDDTIKDDLTQAVKDDIANVIAKYDSVIAILNNIKQDISSWTIDTPFEVIEEVNNLKDILVDMKDIFSTFKNTANAISNIIATKVGVLVKDFEDCYKDILDAARPLAKAADILKGQQSKFDDTKDIGTEVLKFSIDNLPATGYIKLEGAGPRENGDQIEIDLIIRMPDTANGNNATSTNSTSQKNHIIESKTVIMQLIGLRSETVVGIILADSFNENNFEPTGERRFLYAPAASLLLKIGSRNSRFYNEFIDFGLGVAVSTPDFDTDGTPEFGAGLMFTAFKDILSVGINYNVTLDTPYWSFGINLPFTLPGVPINVPK